MEIISAISGKISLFDSDSKTTDTNLELLIMGFRRRLQYFLVHVLNYTNRQARQLVDEGRVAVNGQPVKDNCFIDDWSELCVEGKIVRPKKERLYLRFNKPPGYESSLNTHVKDNIAGFFPGLEGLAIAGRLDKASQGLLLLSNDGQWVETICHPDFEKEKEYLVELGAAATDDFTEAFERGVTIGGYTTLPCRCERLTEQTIRVVLREGKNRQIRRMCHRLGYAVVKLERVRIGEVLLEDLPVGSFERLRVGD